MTRVHALSPKRRVVRLLQLPIAVGAALFLSLRTSSPLAMAGKFIPLAEAAAMTKGLRCTGVPGMPAIWIVAVKSLYHVKKVPVIHVQHPSGDQEELFKLTAQRSNPVSWWADEQPRSAWLEQLQLAERIGSGPQLVPEDPAERAAVIGICYSALGSPGGLAFEKRNLMMSDGPFARKYGWTPELKERAPSRIVALLNFVNDMLEKQKAKGSKYLVGDAISAADVCWAASMNMVNPPPEDIMPVGEKFAGLPKSFAKNPDEVKAATTPLLVEHQMYIMKEYCDLGSIVSGTTLSY